MWATLLERTNNIHRCGPRKVMRAFTSALDRHSLILKQPKPVEIPTTSFKFPKFTKSHSVDSTAVSPLAIDNTDYVSTLARKLSTKQQNTPTRGQASPTSPSAETELRNSHANILLVDDNPINLRVWFSFPFCTFVKAVTKKNQNSCSKPLQRRTNILMGEPQTGSKRWKYSRPRQPPFASS